MKKIISTLLLAAAVCGACAQDAEGILAFPGAEGYGKYTLGGRGGDVYIVTNLNDSGAGSLREAINAKGPRTVVFAVSGTIELKSQLKIKNPYITIAGQTAPGDGICLKNYDLVVSADEVIIRYIRVRPGDQSGTELDAIGGRYRKNIVFDHISASWSVDETMSLYHCENVTVQWCIIAESMYNSNHEKGSHGFGGIAGSNYGTYHHNLIAHHSSRNLRMASGCQYFDYRNNVIYNWGYNSCYGGENQQVGQPDRNFTYVNMVGNYYKPGPATQKGEVRSRIANPSYRDVVSDYGKWYIADNYMCESADVTADNWMGVHPQGGNAHRLYARADEPWDAMPITYHTAEEAYEAVLEHAGASIRRDAVDQRIINDVRTGTAACEGATYKADRGSKLVDQSVKCGIIDSQQDVGGWPELASEAAPIDSDADGMPDEWELAHGLNPNDKNDGKATADNGYTNLENYINSVVPSSHSGITQVIADRDSDGVYYDLTGIAHSTPMRPGIYIKNGKKIILSTR